MIRPGQTGFTLIEILVAVIIFAIVGVMAYSGLGYILNSHHHIDSVAERLSRLQRAMSQIEEDLLQVSRRPIRDAYGDRQPSVLGVASIPLSLTRTGAASRVLPTGSGVQRIEYRFSAGQLIRARYAVLDRAQDSQAQERVLLEGIEEFTVQFLDQNNNEHEIWPPPQQNGQPADPTQSPYGIRFSLMLDDWGSIERLISLQP